MCAELYGEVAWEDRLVSFILRVAAATIIRASTDVFVSSFPSDLLLLILAAWGKVAHVAWRNLTADVRVSGEDSISIYECFKRLRLVDLPPKVRTGVQPVVEEQVEGGSTQEQSDER